MKPIPIPISICIISKNEENHIEECLNRLSHYGMEIILTDTGSTDATKEIAKKYTNHIYDYKWTNNFSAARNFCASHATNDTILSIDCDEYIDSINLPALEKCIKTQNRNIGTLHFKNLITTPQGETALACDDLPRLYNRKYHAFKDPVHEHIAPIDGKVYTYYAAPIEVTHYGYAIPPEQMKRKQERNLSILYTQLKNERNAYIYFQIAQSEMVLENYEAAIPNYESCLAYNESQDLTYIQYAIEGLAKAYVCVGRRTDALTLMERYASECNSARYIFYHANVLMDNNAPLKALVKYVKVTTLPDATPECDELMYSLRHIIDIYHQYGEYNMAKFFEEKYADCLKEREKYR